ncbi:hypothetical protein A3G67_04525 [Candidatus Roizmanbacteria bacterium RIFCSPLOWO2_12_FULL_40_12]|uniref:Glycosyl transferase family 1 n=1 Tax=Candidatus Roizmanbacteria bacterium RIFCSPLOWO2_01_FULL_40_42 TaxID=1802066 RepID=A0A1F7J4R1_9BACT|nr:MAG: hypothetical protein A2779_04625 [Candidatus Roizmanbacteria bacterium RIFCSPHIGHO2_01_FULL_40_98]OGK27359.1 MAG: hypothetical protein A3C31_04950 [Candidatus Roizmanbacteria bacterium RIFCSPHIGHO2_02_FULL_40_53]OGK30769.1 MAG: hypothetical protein A2W49_02090 [Candidatus Roizmanbacteria bacterium RIFCSPHIGHO2_12_41_18]OGK36464.1 MAG: hypothetical protein A3E69_02575 [Candidatus Roizmanbacteria bacterium RIFCSPHIGHO2_12_FULL_40_130]OGK50592.1 MAG: hypothetical protein A3B50_02305 [Candi
MIIGIDGNEANVDELVGVSVYTKNLLSYFQKQASSNLQFEIFLKEKPKASLPPETKDFKYKVVGPSFLWSQISLPLALKNTNLDVFFSPAHYAPRYLSKPLVVTIHDLSYFYYPEEFLKKDLHKLTHWTKYSVEKAKKVIAVSENTKKDLMKFYNVPENKISVIYNGFEKNVPSSKFQAQNSSEPYFLYVGTLQPRKNLKALIKAFNEFKKNNPEYKLKIVGKKGWIFEDIFSLVDELKLTEEITFEGFVSDDKLVNLYKNAHGFVLPSFYEGFGIPILEAMSYGCPVIASNTSSLPEVGEDACLYFDPKNVNELVKRMEESKNPELRGKLIDKGLERVKKFSWEKSAKETLRIIKSAVSQ